MNRFHKGMRIRTSYGSGPYVVTQVVENCTCPRFLDTCNLGDKAPKSRPHVHLVCKALDPHYEKGDLFLNGYDNNLNSVWGSDYLIDLDELTPTILILLL